jgi:hypothetical protein
MSLTPPSFLFSGIDEETLQLHQELESLGGGSAKITPMELYSFILPSRTTVSSSSKQQNQVLWNYQTSIGCRDINLPKDAASSTNMRFYPVSGVAFLPEHSREVREQPYNDLSTDLCDKICEWLNNGYNCCLLNIGMRNAIKTTSFFADLGRSCCSVEKENERILSSLSRRDSGSSTYHLSIEANADLSNCFYSVIMKNLFYYSSLSHQQTNYCYSIGLSCWVLTSPSSGITSSTDSAAGSELIDLMIPYSNNSDPLNFAIIDCPSYEMAMLLMHEARKRAKGCLSQKQGETIGIEGGKRMDESERCHFFARILIHKQFRKEGGEAEKVGMKKENDLGGLSCLYLVDLIGLTNIDNKYFKTVVSNKERMIIRERNQHLQSLFSIFSEMEKLCKRTLLRSSSPFENNSLGSSSAPSSISSSDHALLTSLGRSNKLATLLSPILQGNVKTFLISYLRDDEKHAQETKNILNALSPCITNIQSAVYPCQV